MLQKYVQMGQFWAVLVRMEDRRECSDKKVVSRCRERARRAYYGCVFKAKKEIPVKRLTNADSEERRERFEPLVTQRLLPSKATR